MVLQTCPLSSFFCISGSSLPLACLLSAGMFILGAQMRIVNYRNTMAIKKYFLIPFENQLKWHNINVRKIN